MNKQVLALLGDVAWATLNADKEFQAFENAHNKIVENAIIEGATMMLNIILPLALEIGHNPVKLLDLPETNGGGMFTGA